jgi:hypothetical protein
VKLIQKCHSPCCLNDFALSGAKILNKIESKYNNKEIIYEQENNHHHPARLCRIVGFPLQVSPIFSRIKIFSMTANLGFTHN